MMGLALLDASVTEPAMVTLEPSLTAPVASPMPPRVSPVTTSSMFRFEPSARVNFRVPSAALPVIVILAAAKAFETAFGPSSVVSRLLAVRPAPAAVFSPWAKISTPPTESE
ncbi:hypothetical protein D3C87_1176600 [compost metagenome]